MRLWFLLVIVFLLQEPVTAGAVLLTANQAGYNPIFIHGVFLASTLFDAVAGYWLGELTRRYVSQSQTRIARFLVRKAHELQTFTHGRKRFSLIVYGPVLFPWSAFVAPWLGISLRESVVYFLIGDVVFWYLPLWLIVLGVHTIFPNPMDALYAIAGVTLLISFGLRYFEKRKMRKSATVL